MKHVYSTHAAKTNLSRLIELAESGEEVIIARGSTPVVKLVRLDTKKPVRRFGAMKGQVKVTDAFFEPLPDDILTHLR